MATTTTLNENDYHQDDWRRDDWYPEDHRYQDSSHHPQVPVVAAEDELHTCPIPPPGAVQLTPTYISHPENDEWR